MLLIKFLLIMHCSDPSQAQDQLPPIDVSDLPKCKHCGKLVRPHIVWFGESLDPGVLDKASMKFSIFNILKMCNIQIYG